MRNSLQSKMILSYLAVALLTVLDQVRSAVGPEALLSISAREITPLLPEADLVFNRWFTWRGDYYRAACAG